MFRRSIQQALLMMLACAGLVVPARAAAAGEHALTPALSHPVRPSDSVASPMGEGSPASRPQYRITHWTTENGLPQSSIKALVQTRDGYLWIGTLKGLARFDGVRFKVFDRNNTPEMTHDSINDLAEDTKDGGLWIGAGDGLLHYRDHQFEQYGRGGRQPTAGRQAPGGPAGGRVVLASTRPGRTRPWRAGGNLGVRARP